MEILGSYKIPKLTSWVQEARNMVKQKKATSKPRLCPDVNKHQYKGALHKNNLGSSVSGTCFVNYSRDEHEISQKYFIWGHNTSKKFF